MDFTQKLSEEEELANIFFDLYTGLDRAYGSYKLTPNRAEGGKVQGRATTIIGPYNVKLWASHLLGIQGLGVVPIQDDGTCRWAAIDIDEYPLDLDQLEKDIRKLNIPLLVIRTKSGGAHLVCYFSDPVKCKVARSKMYEFALALGYGGVEIFPKQTMLASKNDVGNWLNMPYFDMNKTQRYALINNKPLNAREFLDVAYKMRITEKQLSDVTVELEGAFEDGPPCLQMIAKSGAPEGTRNNTLFAMGVYAKQKFEDDWQDQVEQLNVDHIQPALKSKEVQIIIKSLNRKEYFYPCNKAPLMSMCNKDLCRKRQFGIGQTQEEFTLNLGSLVKITTEPPIWIMDVEGVRVQLDTEDLMMQERFRKACVMAINRLPPPVKRGDWEKLVREKLETVEIVEAPDESRRSSRINQYAYQYISMTPPARTVDEMQLGRPWFDKEKKVICFRGNDLIRYLDNNGIRAEARTIWASLKEAGAGHGTVQGKNGLIQAWKIPNSLVPELNLEVPTDFDEEF